MLPDVVCNELAEMEVARRGFLRGAAQVLAAYPRAAELVDPAWRPAVSRLSQAALRVCVS